MAERRSRVVALLVNPWFLTGIAFGVLSGLPMVVPHFDEAVPEEVQTVLFLFGAPALAAMNYAVWNIGAEYAYAAFACGCIVNGLLLAAIVEVVRRASLFLRSRTGGGVSRP